MDKDVKGKVACRIVRTKQKLKEFSSTSCSQFRVLLSRMPFAVNQHQRVHF